jgi:beta-mannosidase
MTRGLAADLLAGTRWECAPTPAGSAGAPSELDELGAAWTEAIVPGTAAAALRVAAGVEAVMAEDFDARDWWFRCRFTLDPLVHDAGGPWRLGLDGLATLADVWVNGDHVMHSENMFRQHAVRIDELESANVLAIRFAALTPVLRVRRPRARWRSNLVREQNLRWFRTTLLGRMPGWAGFAAPVGPWRGVTLRADNDVEVIERRLGASVLGDSGVVDVHLKLRVGPEHRANTAVVRVGDFTTKATLDRDQLEPEIRCRVEISDVELWWPHTHGEQPLYPVQLTVGTTTVELGSVGFRTLAVDRSSGGFDLSVNGDPIFCRGVCWVPLDVVALRADRDQLRRALEQVRAAGLNMVRITGPTVYESDDFWDLCDELGILVWQDAMLATLDPPDDAGFNADLEAELRGVFDRLQGRPSLTVVCGGSETEQQAAFAGLPAARRAIPVVEDTIRKLAQEIVPGVPYVTSSPSGGDPPTRLDEGVSHYFGVGAYLRPLADVYSAGVRFASECLAFSAPPERSTVDEVFGGPAMAGHHPMWKRAVPRDAAAAWDFEDVRDFYVREVFGVDPLLVRYGDPERALDLGRAAVAHAVASTFAAWRRPGSRCGGGLVLASRDLLPGAGWGLVDALGRPKSAWYALRRIMQPTSILLVDHGLDGLRVLVVNESPVAHSGRLEVGVFDRRGNRVEASAMDLTVPGRVTWSGELGAIFEGFRDFTYAYRFGAPVYDVVHARFVTDGHASEAIHLPLGQDRAVEPELGLRARAFRADDGWLLEISTRRLAQWVVVDLPGFIAEDSWFDLAPGSTRRLRLEPFDGRSGEPHGFLRALNSVAETSIDVLDHEPAEATSASTR